MPASTPSTVRSESRILKAALGLFAEQGYHGTTIREIARDAGLSVPGVYHHYRSKQDVLVDLMVTVLGELLTRTRSAVDAVDEADVSARFDALVSELVRFHAERREEAFVASTELRGLDPDNRRRVVALRDEQQAMLEACIASGCDRGVFATPYPREAARAVAVLCVGVASWYRPGGGDAISALVRGQLGLCRALVEAR
ncbi:TetR/AcrR family transcriptional regulator [Streptomyces sp. NPDC101776]|uniref:TetR/AcrR family transcriptional regulator n=1 Tax=Streptomyces sp. NPDC101776 TaxID=3366146 RepID=UPI00382F3C6F